jgi:hypothetical protein
VGDVLADPFLYLPIPPSRADAEFLDDGLALRRADPDTDDILAVAHREEGRISADALA